MGRAEASIPVQCAGGIARVTGARRHRAATRKAPLPKAERFEALLQRLSRAGAEPEPVRRIAVDFVPWLGRERAERADAEPAPRGGVRPWADEYSRNEAPAETAASREPPTIPAIEAMTRAAIADSPPVRRELARARRALLSLCHPDRFAEADRAAAARAASRVNELIDAAMRALPP